jgi:uncharacterized RDD family membrane protein YckC
MFTILGGDGKEYGPVTAEQIRAWIASGRANLETKAKVAGSASEWKSLGELPEFTANDLPPVVAAGGEPADRGLRLLAIVIDQLIAFVCMLPGFVVLGAGFIQLILAASQGQQPDLSSLDMSRLLLGVSLLGLAVLTLSIVQIVMISTRGQSIGKRILGIRIVRHPDGSKAGFVNGWLIRSFVIGIIGAIPWLGMIFTLVDICFIFREDRRCIHDLMAGTYVVKVP